MEQGNQERDCVKGTQQLSLQWHKHHDTLISLLEMLWQKQELVDVTLSAGGRCIDVHRIVLCACSKYFQDVLAPKDRCGKHSMTMVILKDVDYEDLEALVYYMYKGEVRINEERLNSFLSAAKSLSVRGLTGDDVQEQSGGCSDLKLKTSNRSTKRKRASSTESSSIEDNKTAVSSPATMPPHVPSSAHLNTLLEPVEPLPSIITFETSIANLAHADHWEGGHVIDQGATAENHQEAKNLGEYSSSPNPTTYPEFHQSLEEQNEGIEYHNSRCDPNGRFSCTRCGRFYKWKQARNRHLKYECGVKPQFECQICQASFHYKNALQRHMETHNRHK